MDIKQIALIESKMNSLGQKNEIVYLDIGSSFGGLPPIWNYFIEKHNMKAIMIDMQDDGMINRYSKEKVIRVQAALGNNEINQEVYLTRGRWCSSFLKPNMDALKEYPVKEWFELEKEIMIPLRRYDKISDEIQLPQPHFIKIDVQGFEKQVLEGMGALLEGVLCIEHETHLRSIYKGQATFNEIYNYLYNNGFRLCDLKPVGVFEGEALEFDAFWYKKTVNDQENKLIDIWKIANNLRQGLYYKDMPAL